MKAKKVLALCVAAAMAMSLAACGNQDAGSDNVSQETVQQSSESTPESSSEAAPESSEAPVEAPAETGPASIDFEDELFGFIGNNTSVAGGLGDASGFGVVDYNGSKALEAVPDGKGLGIGFQIDALLGDKVSQVKTVELTIGAKSPDGKFYACSGKLYGLYAGEKDGDAWSVYLETANPKTAVYEVPEGRTFAAGDYFVVSLETDNASAEAGWQTLYIDNVTFKDASGNVLEADSSAEYVAADNEIDRSNLCTLTDVVEFEGFATSGGGWGQAGFTMPEEFISALMPGSVVEISYSSASGDMWVVMNEAEGDWRRACQPGGEGTPAYYNNAGNIAQITFEQLAEIYGDDVAAWGTSMQCEASADWEVFSVKVGKKAPHYTLTNAVDFEGFVTSGGGWAQAGFTMPQEIIDALVPGSAVEITYTSATSDMWVVLNEAEGDWRRAGQPGGEGTPAITDGSKCYITFEQLAAIYGDDVSKWGTSMQCEASGDWEVYGVRVGTVQELKMVNNLVNFEGFVTSGSGWGQAGFTMPEEIISALVPGSVVVISYNSASGDMWVVMNEAEGDWRRAGQPGGEGTPAAVDGKVCQITFEQLAEIYGDDVSKWGTSMQCEASGDWEVFSVAVGTAAE